MPEPLPLSGLASMYDDGLNHHQVVDSPRHHPDRYSITGYSAALLGEHHGSVPFGTKLELSYHGRRVVVIVNDIGSGKDGQDRVLDLSHVAMAHLIGHSVTNATAGLLTLASMQIVHGGSALGPIP